MLRQLIKSSRLIRHIGVKPQMLAPTSTIPAAYLSSKPPGNNNPPSTPTNDELTANVQQEMRKQMFDKLVRSNKVVVFMKGTPKSPRCGFSNAIVQIFRMHGVQYDSHDVLADDEIREGIKSYTDWPTIPQVFIAGEFVGGCDILLEMHQNGELVEQLEKAGIESDLLKLQREVDEKNEKK